MNNKFSRTHEDGKPTFWYRNVVGWAVFSIIVLHSLFPYARFYGGYYPFMDENRSILVDLFIWHIWAGGTPSLFIQIGRNFGELIKDKGHGFFLNKVIKPYFKQVILFIIPANIMLWYLLCFYIKSKTGIDSSFWQKANHMWFFLYLLLYFLIVYAFVRFPFFKNPYFLSIYTGLKKYPSILGVVIPFGLMMTTFHGMYIGNPAESYIPRFTIIFYFFCYTAYGFLVFDTKNLNQSGKKIALCGVGMFSSIGVFFVLKLLNPVVAGTSVKMVIAAATISSIMFGQYFYYGIFARYARKHNAFFIPLYRISNFAYAFNFPILMLIQLLILDLKINAIAKVFINIILFCLGAQAYSLLTRKKKKVVQELSN